jgi:hypothetical protein
VVATKTATRFVIVGAVATEDAPALQQALRMMALDHLMSGAFRSHSTSET